MNKHCEIVRDLLPLYIDSACSNSSAQMIEEHLPQCNECTEIYNSMKSDEYEKTLRAEKNCVVAHHKKSETRKTLIAGAAISGILCVPIIVCLIVNIALGHALDWFFIVLTALLVFASVVVVPLVVAKKRLLYTIFAFTGSLLLLLLTCAIYTKGRWFPIAGSSVLFGMSVVFSPYIVYALDLPKGWKRQKGLIAMLADTVLLAVMLICVGFYSGTDNITYWCNMPKLVLFNVGFVWVIFLVCRYIGVSKLIRGGIASIVSGAYMFSVNNVVNEIIDEKLKLPWPELHLSTWNVDTCDGNIKWLLLITCVITGIALITAGIVREVKKRKETDFKE